MSRLFSCYYSKLILKISQPKGSGNPKCGCTFEPFGFIKAAGCRLKVSDQAV